MLAAYQRAIPVTRLLKKWHNRLAARYRAIQHHVRIKAHQLPVVIRVTVT
jgi:hypothetical protein